MLEAAEHRDALRDALGPSILNAEGSVDRGRVGQLVFAPLDASAEEMAAAQRRRRALEAILHPAISRVARQQLADFSSTRSLVVIDAPLLLEAGWQCWCRRILYVDTPVERQLAAARQRGWTPQELLQRQATQWPLPRKRAAASQVVTNHGTLEELTGQLDQWLSRA